MNSFFNCSGARPAALCFALALSASALACDDSSDEAGVETGDTTGSGDTTDATGDGDGDAALSHAADIQPIWDANCTVACHKAGGLADYLDLTGDAFGDLVGTPSTQAMGSNYVEAGSSADSYLIAKLRGSQVAFGGSGGSMPGGGAAALPEETIMMIEQWIDEGALP